jgi:chemotaxis protein methyltransferase CheR
MTIPHAQFESLSSLLKRETAVVIDATKDYLIEARLTQIAFSEGFDTVEELVDAVLRERTTPRAQRVLLALTTHETSFFRDGAPFEALKTTILPNLIRKRRSSRTLQIWSAGCSSGQEPYSIAMLIAESFPEARNWKITIHGTDINPALITQANSGVYSSLEVNRGLSPYLLKTYFIEQEDSFKLHPDIRSMVTFSEHNLLRPWHPLDADIIFLRNVLIYFDIPSRKKVLKTMHTALADDGYLVMGTAETTRYLHSGFVAAHVPSANAYIKASPS